MQPNQQLAKIQIVRENFSRVRFIAPILLLIALFLLVIDLSSINPWSEKKQTLYTLLDMMLLLVSVLVVFYFYVLKKHQIKNHQRVINALVVFALNWAAIITGIEITALGFSTFTLVLLVIVFALYLQAKIIILSIVSAVFSLFVSAYFNNNTFADVMAFGFMIVPITVIGGLIANSNYRHKVSDFQRTNQIIDLNKQLLETQKSLEKKVKLRTSELNMAKLKAEESDRLKTEFINNISHEIRTPMNAIVGFSTLLTDADLPNAKKEKFVSTIIQSADKLTKVIDKILQISDLTAQRTALKKQYFYLNDVFVHLQAKFWQQFQDKKIILQLTSPNLRTESQVFLDKKIINDVLEHLLDNALEYTNNGLVEFGYNLQPEQVLIFVKDSGKGISPERENQIFQAFNKQNIENNDKGLGLGIPIVKAFTRLMGAEMQLKSSEKGTHIQIVIPI